MADFINNCTVTLNNIKKMTNFWLLDVYSRDTICDSCSYEVLVIPIKVACGLPQLYQAITNTYVMASYDQRSSFHLIQHDGPSTYIYYRIIP